jgi:hypothetical protein
MAFPPFSALLARTTQTIATGVLLVGMSLAQQTPQEPAAQPTLRVQTDLVVVPFQVRRGSRSVSGPTALQFARTDGHISPLECPTMFDFGTGAFITAQ